MQHHPRCTTGRALAFAAAATLLCAATPALAQPVTISGIVVDELSGEPLDGVEVRIGVPGAIRAMARTDKVGRFGVAFTSEARLFDIVVEASDRYLPCRLQRIAPGVEVQVSLAPRICTVTGRATDAATGEPIPYAYVTAYDGATYAVRVQSDASGLYRLPFDIWQSAAPVAENRLRHGVEIVLEHRDYLPLRARDVDPETHAYSKSPAPLNLVAEPYRREVVIEAFLAGTRNPATGAAFVYGCGPRFLGRTTTDALGHARALVPAWRYRDRPVELNEPTADAWIAHLGQQFQVVRASGVRVLGRAGALSVDPARTPTVIRFSLAPLESATARSSYLVGPPAGPAEAPYPRQEPGETSRPLPQRKPEIVI